VIEPYWGVSAASWTACVGSQSVGLGHTVLVVLAFTIGAEELHIKGKVGVELVASWLNATGRVRIARTVYDINPRTGEPYTQVRVPLLDDTMERFDLMGQLLDEDGSPGNTIYVESKFYSAAGNQGPLYEEYLAVCYSAFAKATTEVAAPASVEFMWATTHPFSQTSWTELTTTAAISDACDKHDGRLGGQTYDPELGAALSERLWLAVVQDRTEELIMGNELRKAVVGRLVEMGAL
jgi:hypothetical protein